MAAYRQVFVSFWQDAFVLDLTPEEKYFYVYLMTNGKTSQCGIYELSQRVIEMDTGYNRETVEKLLERFVSYGKILYCRKTKEIMILNWLKYNLVNSPKVKSCMRKELLEVKNKEFLNKLIDIIREQKLMEDTTWIPYEKIKEYIENSPKLPISSEVILNEYSKDTLSIPQENPMDTISMPKEPPSDTLSIQKENTRGTLFMSQENPINTVSILHSNLIDTVSLDYGEEREREEELEEELEQEVEVEKERKEEKKLLCNSLSLIKYFENLTGQIGALNLHGVKVAVSIHGHYNVKNALEKALQANKPNMNYINGILKNWAVQGYPKQWEVGKNGRGHIPKGNNRAKSSEFKPKEYRDLTEEEWADLDEELL